ncbi:DinB family protein [Dyadobacter sp. CY356]|uniref:DinB family protein n=1 Tax=Dyadobacter sp. CY356 TaxID=2906442 RepID=UPI001F3DBF63|nr:DinB family protein [Dyadobacter sp. CY356]MCF0057012.1 DinB family protein [Dyadobacter sp. CY356]
MENNTSEAKELLPSEVFITQDALLDHWQGHRRITRRAIEAFPDDQFYTFSIGGMRTFAELVMEIIVLSGPGIHGILSGDWTYGNPPLNFASQPPATKQEVLTIWDNITAEIDTLWPQIPVSRFHEQEAAFGQYDGTIYSTTLYIIDNEIHHRAQVYVYLRALGIEPPAFWDRS